MDRFQKVASEILERICSLRTDNDGWKTAKQTVCTKLMINACLVIKSSVYEQNTLIFSLAVLEEREHLRLRLIFFVSLFCV